MSSPHSPHPEVTRLVKGAMEVAVLPSAIANWCLDQDRARGRFGDCGSFGDLVDAVREDFPSRRALLFRLPDAPHGAPRFAIASHDGDKLWLGLAARCFAPGTNPLLAPPLERTP